MVDIIAFILQLASKYPVVATVLMVIGTLRVFFKPIFAAIEVAVGESASKRDDEVLAGFKASKFYKVLVFILDLTASIKLPTK